MSKVIKATLDEDAYAFVKRQAEIAGRSESSIINRCVLLTLERSKEDGRRALEALEDVRRAREDAAERLRSVRRRMSSSGGVRLNSLVKEENRLLDRMERLKDRERALIEGTVGDLLAAGQQ